MPWVAKKVECLAKLTQNGSVLKVSCGYKTRRWGGKTDALRNFQLTILAVTKNAWNFLALICVDRIG